VISRRALLLGGAAAASSCYRRRKTAYAGYAFVANEGGQAVAVVDLSAFAVIRHIRLNGAPTELLSPAARTAVYALCPGNSSLHEISTDTLKPARKVQLPGQPIGMLAGAAGDAIWLLTRSPNRLVRIPLNTLQVESQIALPAEPAHFDLTARYSRAVVSMAGSDSIVQVDLANGKAGAPISLGGAVGRLQYRDDGKQVLIAHPADRFLTALDDASGRVVVKLPLAMTPEHFCFNADGGQLFVTGSGMDAVAIVFPFQTQVAETILAGNAPGPMAASYKSDDTPEYLFVTNPQAGQVTILNIATRKVMAVAPVGADPGTVVITPDNQFALVLNRKSGDMAVLLIQASAKRTKFPAALLTIVPVGSNPVSAVVRRA
jgi:YVTN family beta-propeller protein